MWIPQGIVKMQIGLQPGESYPNLLYIYVRVLSKAIGKFAAKVNTYFSTREFRVNL